MSTFIGKTNAQRLGIEPGIIDNTITEMLIPAGVTKIAGHKFNGCSDLVSVVNVSDDLTAIERYAFYSCSSLVSLTGLGRSTGLSEISEYAFSKCGSSTLEEIVFPGSVVSLGNYAFHLSKIPAITLPGSVSLGNNVFLGCSRLTAVSLGSAGNPIAAIPSGTFSSCANLIAITVYTTGGATLSGSPWGASNATVTFATA